MESHISRKTSEIWGTQDLRRGQSANSLFSLGGLKPVK
jgi:hypothetical protein